MDIAQSEQRRVGVVDAQALERVVRVARAALRDSRHPHAGVVEALEDLALRPALRAGVGVVAQLHREHSCRLEVGALPLFREPDSFRRRQLRLGLLHLAAEGPRRVGRLFAAVAIRLRVRVIKTVCKH